MKLILELKPNPINKNEVVKFLCKHWGSEKIVSKGKITDASEISRVLVKDINNKIVGLATFSVNNNTCELISIDSEKQRKGIGTKMIKLIEKTVKEKGAKRIWLITTNDNYEAVIFYVKNGYRLVEIHKDALDISRKLKPQIPFIGKYGIPLQDEWEFEKDL